MSYFKIKANEILWNLKGSLLKNKHTPGASVILIYHGLVESDPYQYNRRFITIKEFIQQIQLISRKANPVSVENIFEGQTDPLALNVAITFDDGYKNNYKYAADILDEYKVPASFYITTVRPAGFEYLWSDFVDIISRYGPRQVVIDEQVFIKHGNEYASDGLSLKQVCRTSPWNFKLAVYEAFKNYSNVLDMPGNKDYWLLMSDNEIASLSENKLFSIGGHGMLHNNLDRISAEDAMNELNSSKNYLENIIGKKVNEFAFPDGSYTPELIDAVQSAGYQYQLLVSKKYNEKDTRVRERMGINPYLKPANQFRYIQKGDYQ